MARVSLVLQALLLAALAVPQCSASVPAAESTGVNGLDLLSPALDLTAVDSMPNLTSSTAVAAEAAEVGSSVADPPNASGSPAPVGFPPNLTSSALATVSSVEEPTTPTRADEWLASAGYHSSVAEAAAAFVFVNSTSAQEHLFVDDDAAGDASWTDSGEVSASVTLGGLVLQMQTHHTRRAAVQIALVLLAC